MEASHIHPGLISLAQIPEKFYHVYHMRAWQSILPSTILLLAPVPLHNEHLKQEAIGKLSEALKEPLTNKSFLYLLCD